MKEDNDPAAIEAIKEEIAKISNASDYFTDLMLKTDNGGR